MSSLKKLNKVKVLYLVLEMDLGGLQKIVSLLIRKIDKEGFIPYLCCLDRAGLFSEQIISEAGRKYTLNRQPGPFDIRMFGKLINVINKNRIDIIHSHNGCSLYAALAGRLCGVRGIIHTDHGRLVPDRKAAIWEDRLASYLMHRVIGVSNPLTEYLASKVKVRRNKLFTIINGVDSEKFVPISSGEKRSRRREFGVDKSAKVIGTVCRLDPIKNLRLVIDCVPAIMQKIPDFQVVIVGDGPDEKRLKEQVKMLNMNSKIIFLGRIGEVEKVMPILDLYVNTSISEGTSMTILEAMSCGLPVVASAVGGNAGLVDSSNGVLFPYDRADLFQEGVINLLGKKNILENMGKSSRERVEKEFSFSRVVDQYEIQYSTLMNN